MTDGAGGLVLVALVAIVPLVVLMLTSFVKVSVVLALLRNAIGAPDAPSGLVVMGVSLVLTFFVMAPVAIDMVTAAATAPAPDPRGPARPDVPPTGGAPDPRGATAPARPADPPVRVTGAPADPYAPGAGSGAPARVTVAPADPYAPAAGSGAPARVTGAPANPYPPNTGSGAPARVTGAPADPYAPGAGSGTGAPGNGSAGAPPGRPLVALDVEAAVRQIVPARYGLQVDAAARALEPMRAFLTKHASTRDRDSFVGVAQAMGRDAKGHEMWILAPAFLTTELREAFAIAVLIFIPFLVIDLVVGLGLAALGLSTTQPQVVALPLKLLLFVAVDGWRLLVDSLLRGYV